MPVANSEMSGSKGARTRAQVIQGALRALCANGVSATTTRKIAEESGVHLATLHYHFESKGALLMAVLGHLIDETTTAMRVEAQDRTDIVACIEELLTAAWRLMMRTRNLQIVQYELTLYAFREGAEWLAMHQYDAYVNLYRGALLAIAERTRELTPSDCTALARFMLAGIDGLLLQQLAKPNRGRSATGIAALIQSAQTYALALRKERKASNRRARAAWAI